MFIDFENALKGICVFHREKILLLKLMPISINAMLIGIIVH